VNAEFNWWLLIVGLVVGAGLVWYVVFDSRRRDSDVGDRERASEATWLAAVLKDEGYDVPPDAALRLLELHARYLEAPPPDEVPDDQTSSVVSQAGPADAEPAGGAAQPSEVAGDDRRGVQRGAIDVGE
jgi:hypothetical protein